ncbi:MAG: hypothetical protein AAGA27_02560 [Pseudomonadota bacterium]
MKYTELYSHDGLSYFKEVEIKPAEKEALGFYSQPYTIRDIVFRESDANDCFDWHAAPRAQYIVYLSGEVEIQASGGETKLFTAGDILLANDTQGKGHITKVLKKSMAVILRK